MSTLIIAYLTQSHTQTSKRYMILPCQIMDDPTMEWSRYKKHFKNIQNRGNSAYGEYEAIKILQQSGFEIIELDPDSPSQYGIIRSADLDKQKKPDIAIENQLFDIYTPRDLKRQYTNQFINIRRKILQKVDKDKQVDRIVLNTLNYKLEMMEHLRKELNLYFHLNYPKYIPNLKEILLVRTLPDRLNYVISLTPTGDCINPSNRIS